MLHIAKSENFLCTSSVQFLEFRAISESLNIRAVSFFYVSPRNSHNGEPQLKNGEEWNYYFLFCFRWQVLACAVQFFINSRCYLWIMISKEFVWEEPCKALFKCHLPAASILNFWLNRVFTIWECLELEYESESNQNPRLPPVLAVLGRWISWTFSWCFAKNMKLHYFTLGCHIFLKSTNILIDSI